MPYLIGLGWDVPLAELYPLTPQPRTWGIQVTQRDYAPSGAVADQGRFVEFLYNMVEDTDTYQDVLSQYGILNQTTAQVTVYVQNQVFDWVRLNGIAVQPQIGRDGRREQYYLRDFAILIKGLRSPSA